MLKIGNLHIGIDTTGVTPEIVAGEAYLLRDFLERRYLCLEATQLYQQFAHDKEFKHFIGHAINSILEPQISQLEKEMNRYQLPLPTRPPKNLNSELPNGLVTDEFLFNMVYQGCQEFLNRTAFVMSCMVHSDPLRNMFCTFFDNECESFDDLCKYGKIKGWLKPPLLLGSRDSS